MKTAEEIIMKRPYWIKHNIEVWERDDIVSAMNEYARQYKEENERLREDVSQLFNALFDINSNLETDTLEKCMNVAREAIDNLLDKSIIDNHFFKALNDKK